MKDPGRTIPFILFTYITLIFLYTFGVAYAILIECLKLAAAAL